MQTRAEAYAAARAALASLAEAKAAFNCASAVAANAVGDRDKAIIALVDADDRVIAAVAVADAALAAAFTAAVAAS